MRYGRWGYTHGQTVSETIETLKLVILRRTARAADNDRDMLE